MPRMISDRSYMLKTLSDHVGVVWIFGSYRTIDLLLSGNTSKMISDYESS